MFVFRILSPAVIIAVLVQVMCQLFKFVYYSIVGKKMAWYYLFSAGGMPSSHSAFVTALSISIGMISGFQSELFALAFVFSVIVIYDSFSLRGTVQVHSRVLQKLSLQLPAKEREDIPTRVGHTVPEIIAGVITGAILAPVLYLFLIQRFLK